MVKRKVSSLWYNTRIRTSRNNIIVVNNRIYRTNYIKDPNVYWNGERTLNSRKSIWNSYIQQHEKFLARVWWYRFNTKGIRKSFIPNVQPWFTRISPDSLIKIAKYYSLLLNALKEDYLKREVNLQILKKEFIEILIELGNKFNELSEFDIQNEDDIISFLKEFDPPLKAFMSLSVEIIHINYAYHYHNITKKAIGLPNQKIDPILGQKSFKRILDGTKIAKSISSVALA